MKNIKILLSRGTSATITLYDDNSYLVNGAITLSNVDIRFIQGTVDRLKKEMENEKLQLREPKFIGNCVWIKSTSFKGQYAIYRNNDIDPIFVEKYIVEAMLNYINKIEQNDIKENKDEED